MTEANVSHLLNVSTNHVTPCNNLSCHFNVTQFYANFVPQSSVGIGVYDLLCSLPGLIVNCLFIIIVIRNYQLRKTLTLLVLLSCGDILISMGNFALGLSDLLTYNVDIVLYPYQCFYKRPHVNFFIIGIQLQACATLLVAAERTVAVCYPYKYFQIQTKKVFVILCTFCILVVFCTYCIAIILSKEIHYLQVYVKDEACQPALVAGVEYGGFLYIFPAGLGMVAISFYVVILSIVVRNKIFGPKTKNTSFSRAHQRREMWLLKIACVLACSTFLFIVIPYLLLFIRRYNFAKNDTTLPYLRRYVTLALSTNSFLGITLCLLGSVELRTAAKATILCRKVTATNGLQMQLSSFSSLTQTKKSTSNSSHLVAIIETTSSKSLLQFENNEKKVETIENGNITPQHKSSVTFE